jgi:hypothetical protein
MPNDHDPTGGLYGMHRSARQLKGGAAEVVGESLGGSLFCVPPAGEIEVLTTQQRQ